MELERGEELERGHRPGTQRSLRDLRARLGPQVKEAKFSIPSEVTQQPFFSLIVSNALDVGLGASVSPSNIRLFLQAVLGTESRL